MREYLDKRIPGRRPATAEEVARLVAAIFAEDIPFLTGETIYIDGGQGIAPLMYAIDDRTHAR